MNSNYGTGTARQRILDYDPQILTPVAQAYQAREWIQPVTGTSLDPFIPNMIQVSLPRWWS
ncbi:hypothetical protein FRC10_005606, partial [Ceratobasidium sp. 414]